ncbi:S1 domain-containing RNA-binding protein [Ruminiclostridium cellobioparum]|uniref:Putative RNA binding protein (Contains ribosomal protein S1 domain) n=1 Tax=Ruminiclostridium cellobioparum subsp. termitidis CT1112 TaxID=1195236 RepID=S0FMC6_RUMCE|nr:S1 domain-containing RNA-binding protein [Ruminiclostridium cellobioparum]EMS70294.1 putative RNA binding protein (contains ribosomal protein S1 domain) [Ruminiclostridium cellobioparum subsp. termitidis CT1112]
MPLEVGQIIEGKVTGITAFGAFIQLPEGKTGLVHISEVAQEYVKDISSHLKENQLVKVKVLTIDQNGKVSLSIKKACDQKPPVFVSKAPMEVEWNSSKNSADNVSFEDRLAKFMKDSDEKLHDLKKSMDSKRGNSGYRKSAQY